MVTAALREAVDALGIEDRMSLLEHLERTIDDLDDEPPTDEQLATISHRDAEMDADPTIGTPEEEFFRQVRARLK